MMSCHLIFYHSSFHYEMFFLQFGFVNPHSTQFQTEHQGKIYVHICTGNLHEISGWITKAGTNYQTVF